jgi:molybdenum-dependent DNA-binding transcriptional regulator ModE
MDTNTLKISPEGLELANAYLSLGSIDAAAYEMGVPVEKAAALLDKAEVKNYINSVYMDRGYRNRFKLGALIDEIIESKLEEARESEVYSSKDLLDVITLAHKMRMDEIAAQQKAQNHSIANQTNVQINGGNYGKLMDKLLGGNKE